MVYSRSQLCAVLIPPRCRHRRHSDVSLILVDASFPFYIWILTLIYSLSWADTAASTFGRLYGSHTRKLPARLPFLRLPLAPRKSLAGFTAATITGAAAAFGFWGFVAPIRNGGLDISWAWQGGVRQAAGGEPTSMGASGLLGLLAISVVAGLVSGVAEALGMFLPRLMLTFAILIIHNPARPRIVG